MPLNGISAFTIQELPTQSNHTSPGTIQHQEEAAQHWTVNTDPIWDCQALKSVSCVLELEQSIGPSNVT